MNIDTRNATSHFSKIQDMDMDLVSYSKHIFILCFMIFLRETFYSILYFFCILLNESVFQAC